MEKNYTVLIVSSSEKNAEAMALCAPDFAGWKIERASSSAAAASLISEKAYDIIIVNAKSAADYESAKKICASACASAVLLPAQMYEIYAPDALSRDIVPVKKPFTGDAAKAVFTCLTAAAGKVRSLTQSADGMRATIDDMKIITRAKLLLMDRLKMDESAAHRYIEKQAMNMRISRRKVAEGIIGTYEM